MHSFDADSRILSIPRLGEDPLPERINLSLYGLLLSIVFLHREEQKTNFAVITHRDPDADAIAAMLGMNTLLHGMLPACSVRFFYELSGKSSSHTRELSQVAAQRLVKLSTMLHSPALAEEWAVVLVDQPSVFSPQISGDGQMFTREADIILDHHGQPLSRDAIVIEPCAGSTSALMLRALQIATQSEMISDAWTNDSRLLSFLVSGAEIDAGISQNIALRDLNAVSCPIVDWVRSCASADKHRRELDRLRHRLDLSTYSQELLNYARIHKVSLGECEVALPSSTESIYCEVAYAGPTSDKTLLADCADRVSKQIFAGSRELALVFVFGVLRPSQDSTRDRLTLGDSIQVAIRANSPDIPVDTIAKLLASSGGGRPRAAAASLVVPHSLLGTSSPQLFLAEATQMVRQRLCDEGTRWSTS